MGLLSVYRTGGADPCNEDDAGLALDAASHTALCIDNARRFTREHTIAATVQRHRLTLYPACIPPATHNAVHTQLDRTNLMLRMYWPK